MYEELKGKRLLILGGIAHAMEIVKAAHEMGVEVFVTDYNEKTPTKAISDKSFMVSTTDVDSIIELCEHEKVDGIITGFIDSMLPFCEIICRKLNKPFWGTKEQIEVCINKKKFKEMCEKYDVPVIKEYHIKPTANGLFSEASLSKLSFPVLIKPVDNSGSRGVFVCHDREEFINNYSKSLEFSKSKNIIIEQYVQGQHVNMYYTLSNGNIFLSAMADRYVDYLNERSAPLPVCLIHPSVYISEYISKVDNKIKKMFHEMGMRDGVAFVQGFRCDDGSFLIYEMGYRLNGGATYSLIDACSNYNQLKMLIRFCLIGKMGEEKKLENNNPFFKKLAVNFVLSVDNCDIGRIDGIEEIRNNKNVVNIVQTHFNGDKISGHGGSAQVIAYILFVSDNIVEVKDMLRKIYETVRIYNTDGILMNITHLDEKQLLEGKYEFQS